MRATTKDKLFSYLQRSITEQGLSALNIDKICRELKMSKKTIYSEYNNKEELLNDYIFSQLRHIEIGIEEIMNSDKKAADKLISYLMQVMTVIMPNLIPILKDIELLYPVVWKDIERFRASVMKTIIELFKELEENNYLNPGINAEQMGYILFSIIQSTIRPQFFRQSKYAPNDLLIAFIRIIFEGGFHPKLYKELEELITKMKENEEFL